MPPYTTSKSLSPKLVLYNSEIRLTFKGTCLKQDKATFTSKIKVNLFVAYELDTWSKDLSTDFTLTNCLFGSVKLTKNANSDKYKYSGYEIRFNSRSLSSLANFDWVKNGIIFGVDMSSSVHIDNKKKDI